MNIIHEKDKTVTKLLPPQAIKPGVRYIPSQFVFEYSSDCKNYIYNTITKQCLEADLPRSAYAGEGYDYLIENYFLVPPDKDECAFYESLSELVRKIKIKKTLTDFTVLPTLGCNARCVYCYEAGMKQVTMTPEVIDATVDFICKNSGKSKIRITWFGGEPLLCTDIIDKISGALRERGVDFESGMISNAALLTDGIIEKMVGDWNLTGIQISTDGEEKDYIERKRYYTYRDEYRRIPEYVNKLTAKGISVSLRCNVDAENWDGISNFLSDLDKAIADKSRVQIYFCLLNEVRESDMCAEMWRRVNDIKPEIRKLGFRDFGFYGANTTFRINHCLADGQGVVIAPDGNLYLCEECHEQSYVGSVFDGGIDTDAKKAFCDIGKTREKCRKCVFLPECTSFASCPVQDKHCKEVRLMLEEEMLGRLVSGDETDNVSSDAGC